MNSKGMILAIESSCDETSAAVVEMGRQIRSNIILSQIGIHQKFGGVVPEVASRKHIEWALPVVDQALKEAGVSLREVDGIAVTSGPGLVGALLVGVAVAKGLAFATGLPLIGVHHLEGHIAAAWLADATLEPPFLALVVSGGHTSLVEVKDYNTFRLLGQTLDDAAGEAYDKVARLLKLPYPGGPYVEKIALEGNERAIAFPRALSNRSYDFSFSGLKSAVINYLHKAEQKKEEVNFADVAASFQAAVGDVLVQKTLAALEELGHQKLALVGGVASNQYLRNRLETELKKRNIQLIVPSKELCTDNAAMIGSRAYYQWKENRVADFSLNATPAWVLGK
ncbi:MAG: tRNA (adenosine(37)-N6)-threonylcarbamoyltransferase complex transferase subunit TsaD [Negativicutes bacterium]|jgi:N6-L-threonylcarbamoyladenine synthase|nr:tRNA (adenosine(37)-N6)-threonylcarbamoyltransferase complex transferase subunit TsaD [Negativicutes bacterium]